ncbi:MAG: SDR family oxidoreductase [Rhodospirillaceae bacterium]|jgi:NAD(P)-dependent dehydrogenase (short-subunit alcohol dehydrogenase family)|nr:SDR family oxidoreductase [Rhodospirillaceae bacterium]MBT3885963.1 SDR family oxidoreductase [Rhodospirillaceae bacterium]MBT4115903.1 SDR family oxidoreductase [Rhodospirillaceae bacterium]MBT4672613.1 SDR family oxidoreductase [Rhodospirillaceae bacterium]MBT4719051.1 SDR family oxidoreductase [Rhodospirillaceae bacterium]
MPTMLVTGANRGLGLELVRQYLELGWTAVACCRGPGGADALNALADGAGDRLSVFKMDVNNAEEIAAVAKTLDGAPIDLLINNAGIVDSYGTGVAEGNDDPDLKNYDHEFWLEILNTNVVAPGRIIGAFADNVAASDKKLIAMMTSGLGSVANTWQAGRYAYRTSKAGLNMLTRSAGEWLEKRDITIIAIAPGWTRTELGGPSAPTAVEESVAGMRAIFDRLTIADTGTYWNFDGQKLPW